MATPARLVLLDGTALIYRAFYAIPGNLRTSQGLPTNAIYGFALSFQKIMAGRNPDFGAVVFDAPGGTFRDEAYAEYKADRAPMQSDMSVQIPHIEALVDVHAYPTLKVPGYEADDVIGTLTEAAVKAGHEVLIVSGDKDFCQLIGPQVRMLDPMRDITYDAELVRKKWGVPPEQFVDLLALMGDKIDNIPGVPGIGKKGAAQLLEAHGSLEAIIESQDALPKRYATKIGEHVEQARLSARLATIDRAVPLEVDLEALRLTPPDRAALDTRYTELEFYSLLSKEGRDEAASTADAVAEVIGAEVLQDWLTGQATLSVAAVADGEHAVFATLAGLALVRADGEAGYVDVREGVPGPLRAALEDPEVQIWAHDTKRLEHALKNAEVSPQGLAADTMLASFLVDPTKLIPHRIDQLTREYLQRPLPEAKALLGSGKKAKRFADLPAADIAAYGVAHARAVHELWPKVEAAMSEAKQADIYRDQELKLARLLVRVERAGIAVDTAVLASIEAELTQRLTDLEARIHEDAGHPFNIGSTKQLATVLFEELELPVIKRTKTGYSTTAEVLERLQGKHPIIERVLEHRQVAKLINTYTNVLQAAVRPETGRIHASFQQTVGATGRLISTDPDLQRTPIRTEEGKRIRQAFVARPGHRLISADWSQIELRILAHVSADPALVAAFESGADVHARTAGALFSVAPDAVDVDQRRIGKTVNFATVYGQGATALGQILGIPRAEAQAYIEAYFTEYAGVRAWLDRTTATASETGYVYTLAGRRRFIPEIFSHSFMDKQTGLRIAANTPIQGSAADLCKQAMLQIQAALDEAGLNARMLLQVHDELVFEVPEAEVEAVAPLVKSMMETAAELSVPLVADVGVGATWAEAH